MAHHRHKNGISLTDLRTFHHQMPRWVLILLALGIATVVASHITHLLMMLTAAAVIAYMFSPVICSFERLGVKRSVAVVLFFLLAALFVITVHRILLPDFRHVIVNAYAKFFEFSRQVQEALVLIAQGTAERYPFIESAIMKFVDNVFNPGGFLEKTVTASEVLRHATPVVVTLILVPFFAFFLLKDWPDVLKRVMDWVPPSYVETTISVMGEINILVGQYLRGLAADCLVIGILASTGLWVIGINSPIMLGVLTGVANVIPYLGPILGCTVSALIAMLQYRSLDPIMNVVALYLAIKLMDDLVLQPLLIGKSVHLHPMLVVITLIVGEQLFGIPGMILGVPVVTAAQKTAGILLAHRRETLTRNHVRQHLVKPPMRPI